MYDQLMTLVAAGGLEGNITYGLAALGAGIGIGLIGFKAAESTARNPQSFTKVLVISLILAALIEGVSLIAILLK